MSTPTKPIDAGVRMRTFNDWADSLDIATREVITTPERIFANSAYAAGQRSVFAALHELSYHTKSSEEFILRAGILYGEALKGGRE